MSGFSHWSECRPSTRFLCQWLLDGSYIGSGSYSFPPLSLNFSIHLHDLPPKLPSAFSTTPQTPSSSAFSQLPCPEVASYIWEPHDRRRLRPPVRKAGWNVGDGRGIVSPKPGAIEPPWYHRVIIFRSPFTDVNAWIYRSENRIEPTSQLRRLAIIEPTTQYYTPSPLIDIENVLIQNSNSAPYRYRRIIVIGSLISGRSMKAFVIDRPLSLILFLM